MYKRALWLIAVFAVGIATGVAAMWAFQQRQPTTTGHGMPAASDAKEDADKLSSLVSDLQTIRSQLALYRVQHGEYPSGITSREWVARLTGQTDVRGMPGTDFGPYLSCMPTNPFNQSWDVLVDEDGTIPPGTRRTAGWDACGWHFNVAGGRFSPNDSPEHGRL